MLKSGQLVWLIAMVVCVGIYSLLSYKGYDLISSLIITIVVATLLGLMARWFGQRN